MYKRTRGPLTESEHQWCREFEDKLQALNYGKGYQTAFLDPLQQELAAVVLGQKEGLSYAVYGGYPGAERACLFIYPAGLPGALPAISHLAIRGKFAHGEIGHRDILGALMALGLRRDQIGDVVLHPGGGEAAVMVLESKVDFVCANLDRVGSCKVECRPGDPESICLPEDEGKEMAGTVASLRLDAVLSLGFGLSRSRAAALVKSGRVRINWRPVESPSRQLQPGDVVSLPGRGRLELVSRKGETRKGRIRVSMKKFR